MGLALSATLEAAAADVTAFDVPAYGAPSLSGYAQLGSTGSGRAGLSQVCDANGDGRMDSAEYTAMFYQSFRFDDADGDDQITPAEAGLTASLVADARVQSTAFTAIPSLELIQAMAFVARDLNGDGVISWSEERPQIEAGFGQLDLNGDAWLSLQEVSEAHSDCVAEQRAQLTLDGLLR